MHILHFMVCALHTSLHVMYTAHRTAFHADCTLNTACLAHVMYTAHCNVHYEHCNVHYECCTGRYAHCPMHWLTLHSTLSVMCIEHGALRTSHCTLHWLTCILNCISCYAHNTLKCIFWPMHLMLCTLHHILCTLHQMLCPLKSAMPGIYFLH